MSPTSVPAPAPGTSLPPGITCADTTQACLLLYVVIWCCKLRARPGRMHSTSLMSIEQNMALEKAEELSEQLTP